MTFERKNLIQPTSNAIIPLGQRASDNMNWIIITKINTVEAA